VHIFLASFFKLELSFSILRTSFMFFIMLTRGPSLYLIDFNRIASHALVIVTRLVIHTTKGYLSRCFNCK
jgi:hypothetical protein